MPAKNDEDYDGVDRLFSRTGPLPALRWNKFKWALFFMNIIMSGASLTAMTFCLLTWFNTWERADIVRVGNRPELILSTFAASMGILSSLVGWAGIVLNNRCFLAWYTLLLWVTFAFLAAPGYVAYKKHTFNLEGKLNYQWSRTLGINGRLRIQARLRCCGYFSPYVEASVSQVCYARSVLPGCKNAYMKFERQLLELWYKVVFSLVPLQIAIILTALLCANHVTYRFGKGMTPKAYRIDVNSMAILVGNYTNIMPHFSQVAEQYDASASRTLSRSSGQHSDLILTVPS